MARKNVLICIGISVIVILLVATVASLTNLFKKGENIQTHKVCQKMVIDHDGGADDAMAIFIALLYEQYFDGPSIVGLTTTHGNVNENQVFENSQRILDAAQRRDVPIYRGSTSSLVKSFPSDFYYGEDGLGDLKDVVYTPLQAQPEHAVNTLIDMAKKYEGNLTVVSIGPSTNIALAIKMDPQFISRLAHLYIAAGNIYSEKYPNPEFNALIDVEAYYIVADNAIQEKVTFIPFSPFYERHNISIDWRLNVFGAIDTPLMQLQNKFESISLKNNTSSIWNDLDPKAMAMVLNKTLVEENLCSKNSIVLCGEHRGINVNNITDCTESNVNIALPATDEYFKTFLYDIFSSELR